MKIPAGMVVKQIIDEKRLKAQEVADKMGVSRQAIYQSYAKMVFSEGDMVRWSNALGVTKEEFLSRWKDGSAQSEELLNKDSSNYLLEHLSSLEEQFKRLLNQIDVKDRQIEGLQEMLKMTLGKPEPATVMAKEMEMYPGGYQLQAIV